RSGAEWSGVITPTPLRSNRNLIRSLFTPLRSTEKNRSSERSIGDDAFEQRAVSADWPNFYIRVLLH
ncbi:unnamed protein product, partial [Oikopleura dioica]